MNPSSSSMPSSSAPQQRCTFCLEAVSSQSQFGGRSLVTTDCTVHSQAHLDCIYENLKSGETDSLSERDCKCGPNMSLFRNKKPLLKDAYQKRDLEALNKMGLVSEPTNQHESTFLTVASNCYTERFMTMWRADQEQLSFTMRNYGFEKQRNELKDCLQTKKDILTDLLKKVTNDFQNETGSTHRPPNLDDIIRKIEKTIEALKSEHDKLQKSEFVLSVFGAFNSGKSTTINAIVGMGNLPYRDSAMTALPTLIRHTPGNADPVLKLGDKTDALNKLLFTLREEIAKGLDIKNKPLNENHELSKLKTNPELKQVLDDIVKPDYKFKPLYHKEDEIQKCLLELNYVIRILKNLSKESNKIEFNIEEFFQPSSIPVVEVEFNALRDVKKDDKCSFSLMDTPGYGESNKDSEKILKLIEKLLTESSTAIAVLDKGNLEGSISEDIYDKLEKFAKSQPNNDVYVWVNKFDQKKSNDRDVPEIKDIVSNNVEHVKPYNIFPVSSHYAHLAYMVERELNTNGCLKEAKNKSWVQDFFNAHYPTTPMEEEYLGKENQAMVRKDVERLRNLSRYQEAIETCISSPYTRAQLLIIASANMRLEQSDLEIKEIEKQIGEINAWINKNNNRTFYKKIFVTLSTFSSAGVSLSSSFILSRSLIPLVKITSSSLAVSMPAIVGIIGGGTAAYCAYKFSRAVFGIGYSWLYPYPLAQRRSSEPKQPTELYTILEKYKNSEPNQNAPCDMSSPEDHFDLEIEIKKNCKTVRDLIIKKGINVNTKLKNGGTFLHFAIQNGSEHSVESLIGEGRGRAMEIVKIMSLATSMIKTVINDGKFAAAMDLIYKSADFCKAIKNLTHRGADVNATNEKGYTPLHLAAEGNHQICLQHLVNAGANVNAREKDGKTPLHIAAQHGNSKCLEDLLSKKTDVSKNLIDAYENLKQVGVVINDLRQKYDESKISIAVKILQLINTIYPALNALADVGINIDARTKKDETPLHIAAKYGNVKCVELLIKNGADLSAKMDDGDTPLDLAEMNSDPKCKQIVQILKEELRKQKSRNTPAYSFAT